MQTVKYWLEWTYQQFEQSSLFYAHGSDNAWDEAVYLVMTAMGFPVSGEPQLLKKIVHKHQQQTIQKWVKKRKNQRIPLAYITGTGYFCGLEFIVDERVLIPRSPIAELIEGGFSPWLKHQPQRVLDLCTGSGCIAIACGYAFRDARLVASDLSEQALAVAKMNRVKHQQQHRLSLVQGDLFEALKNTGSQNRPCFDLIVTNPPYVDATEMADLPAEFKLEPELALAAGEDGLELVHIILKQAADFLTEQGILVVEVGNSAAALEQSYPEVPFTWIDFAYGGDGVFVLTRSQLDQYF